MRESCYACPFKCNRHGYYSDISIADFWRIGKTKPLDVDDYEKGISAVIVNTERAGLSLNRSFRIWKSSNGHGMSL